MSKPTTTFGIQLPIEAVKPYPGNPRHHPKLQLKRLAANIEKLGISNALLVDEAGVLIAGHGRLEAARQLGLSTLPVTQICGLSEAQKKEMRISDNRLPEGSSWSPERLASELQSIIELGGEIEMTGYTGIEVERALTLDAPAAEDEPDIEAPPERPVARRGDLWALGPHRLLCGDARDPDAYLRLLGEEKVDLVITDAPFNVPIAGHASGKGVHQHAEFAMASGEMSDDAFAAFLREVMVLARGASRSGSLHYWFMDWRSIDRLVGLGREVYDEYKNLIVWAKPNPGMGAMYRSQHELVAVFKHGSEPHTNNIQLGRLGRNRSNLWQYPGGSGFHRQRAKDLADHPTIKNTRMIADAIRDASNPGDLVLDPFAGSGTINLAAEHVGRRAVSIEYEPCYCDVALRRYQDQTGQEPVLYPELTPFTAVRAARLAEESGWR